MFNSQALSKDRGFVYESVVGTPNAEIEVLPGIFYFAFFNRSIVMASIPERLFSFRVLRKCIRDFLAPDPFKFI